MDGVFHHHEDRSINDSDYESDDEASDMEPSVPQSPSIDGKAPTDLAENRLFHKGLARKSSLVQPASSPCSCNALVEDADNEEYSDDEYAYEPLTQESEASERRSYRSWLPLPTRLLEYEQIPSYVQLVSDDEMSDTEPLLETSEPKKHTVSRSWIPIPAKKVIGR
ncbi:hypothetical protein N7457_002248 [Penicillium paradoxum]|uniref:uncharacterized protein n=1 Tax=Penicillium paradoxum TaxID=176176 RepID=UPI00254946CF|nr:uncharacterized protein N7457_002248 [Penicillium paradoxum]KAJ5787258.1 hypothetical protein N7457_002248 [Penicillium paradoxum]